VCTYTERCIRFVARVAGDSLPQQRNMRLALQTAVLEKTQHLTLFSCPTDDHSCKVDVFEYHSVNLIRLIVDSYVNIRFYHMKKKFTEKLHSKNVRFNSNKQVLFLHQ
jgi:hypothetical protein